MREELVSDCVRMRGQVKWCVPCRGDNFATFWCFISHVSRLVTTTKLLSAHAWHSVSRISWTGRNLCVTDGTTWHAILRGSVETKFVPVWGLLNTNRPHRCCYYSHHSACCGAVMVRASDSRTEVCGKPKIGSHSVLKTNRSKTRHPFRQFTDKNCVQSNPQCKLKVTKLLHFHSMRRKRTFL